MKTIEHKTPVSDLLMIKAGDDIIFEGKTGKVEEINFEETNTYWEMIFTLTSNEKIYVRKEKTAC